MGSAQSPLLAMAASWGLKSVDLMGKSTPAPVLEPTEEVTASPSVCVLLQVSATDTCGIRIKLKCAAGAQ